MQAYDKPYRSSFHCLVAITKKEGFAALYRSYTAQIAMDIPFMFSAAVVYETCQKYSNPAQVWDPLSQLVCGGISGVVAGAVSNPFDVCKTLLNTQDDSTLGVIEKTRIKTLLML
ncbi:mitoferrin-1 [Caerostris extrusa]|uniref:Mitoferrin-1 n=1 Tax=Caerostris extrusa TaxID=172846 RepID=A0AAV4WH60_CAEEX|nr:mitoferrin-1 [Caerostris extrusa]